MNTEANQENSTKMTAGQRLRQAREQLGLSQQAVAERLCLKLSTIRQIEEESTPADLAPTFLRGYLRSYAKLVHISEDELSAIIGKQAPIKVPKVASMQGFSLAKSRKKRDGWLMGFTWVIVLVVLGLTGAWWWQNHQAQQAEIVNMADQSTAQLNQDASQGQPIALNNGSAAPSVGNTPPAPAAGNTAEQTGTSVALNTDTQGTAAPAPSPAQSSENTAAANSSPVNSSPVNSGTVNAPADAAQSQAPAAVATSQPAASDAAASGLPTGDAQTAAANVDADTVAITFKAECWLQIDDANGKTLFSGLKKGGESLNVKGKAPYKLKIGAPAAVEIQYQGKPVDLSRFVKSSRVARLTLAAE